MVLGKLWRFMKRHKGKLFTFSALTAGAYMSYTYLRSKLEEMKEKQMTEAFDVARKQAHYESNQRTCNTTVLSLLPDMKDLIQSELNCEKLTELLQSKPTNKVHLWSELKTLAFCRAILSIYCTSLLTLTLRVQLNIIGGCMYARNQRAGVIPAADNGLYDQYLGTIRVFLSQRILELCHTVQHNVERELMSYSLKYKMTRESLRQTIDNLRRAVEGEELYDGSFTCSAFSKYVMLDANTLSTGQIGCPEDDILLKQIISDTNDVLQSMDYAFVLQECFRHGFDTLHRHLDHCFSNDSLHDGSVAVAKLIPPLVYSIHVVCPDAADGYIQELFSLSCLQEFGHHMYTAFSQPPPLEQSAET